MTLQEQAEALLDDIRNALSITWEDADTDKQIKGIIARGIARLNDIAGIEVDYIQEDSGKELLINYCFYARNNALDQFFTNYLMEISAFQLREEVKQHIAENADGEGSTIIP